MCVFSCFLMIVCVEETLMLSIDLAIVQTANGRVDSQGHAFVCTGYIAS